MCSQQILHRFPKLVKPVVLPVRILGGINANCSFGDYKTHILIQLAPLIHGKELPQDWLPLLGIKPRFTSVQPVT